MLIPNKVIKSNLLPVYIANIITISLQEGLNKYILLGIHGLG